MAVHDVRVTVFYGNFVVRDQWCDAGDDGESLTASREHVVAASTYQLTVQALSHVCRLVVRFWDAEPPPAGGGWDGRREVALHCPTGELVVEQITAGAAAEITCPSGAGVYGMRAYWRNRETARELVMGTYGEFAEQPFERLEAALRQLDGTEEFLIDAWRQGPLPPDEDDDDFYGDDWS